MHSSVSKLGVRVLLVYTCNISDSNCHFPWVFLTYYGKNCDLKLFAFLSQNTDHPFSLSL